MVFEHARNPPTHNKKTRTNLQSSLLYVVQASEQKPLTSCGEQKQSIFHHTPQDDIFYVLLVSMCTYPGTHACHKVTHSLLGSCIHTPVHNACRHDFLCGWNSNTDSYEYIQQLVRLLLECTDRSQSQSIVGGPSTVYPQDVK